MSFDKVHIRHVLLHEFRLGHSAAEAHRNLCQAEGEEVMSVQTCLNWYKRFQSGDFSLEDKEKSGRPVEIDLDKLCNLVEDDPRLSTRYLARVLGCSHSTIDRQLI